MVTRTNPRDPPSLLGAGVVRREDLRGRLRNEGRRAQSRKSRRRRRGWRSREGADVEADPGGGELRVR